MKHLAKSGIVQLGAIGGVVGSRSNTIIHKNETIEKVVEKKQPNIKENKSSMKREVLKSIVKEVMKEEEEYQNFFKSELEKTGKSIPDMSDEEKKDFFNKIDAAWKSKDEKKNEGNAFGAAVADAKEKGEDEFEVGGKEYKVEEALSVDPRKVYGGTGAKEGMVLVAQKGLEKILDLSKKNPSNVFLVSDDNYTKFGPYYVKNGKVAKYTVANPNYDFEKNKVSSLKVKSDVILKFKIVEGVESVNEGQLSVGDTIKVQAGNTLQKMNTIDDKWKVIKKDNSTYTLKKVGSGIKVRHYQTKVDYLIARPGQSQLPFVVESLNEASIDIKVGDWIKVVDNPYWEAALGKKGPFKRKVKGIHGDSVFFTDGSNSSIKYIKK